MSGYRFHAGAPPGEWLNDPNGLAFVDRRYRLYAQHSVDGPRGGDVGWGAFVSDDLLRWDWVGVAVPPSDAGSAYSGSLTGENEALRAWFTRHDAVRLEQTQHVVTLDGSADERPLAIPAARNRRDPFVWFDPAEQRWQMLLAEPCDWTGWRDDPPSRLTSWSSQDGRTWRCDATIGPWHAPGVMWEVPVLLDLGEAHALILSLVDRRTDRALCSVRYWLGRLDGHGWTSQPGFPVAGVPLDYGPDFYAAIANLATGWPLPQPVVVAWASNWRDARQRRGSGGSRGGPMTLPRTVRLDAAAGRLRLAPLSTAIGLASDTGIFGDRLELPGLSLSADRVAGQLTINDGSPQMLDWLGTASSFTAFRDGDLLELFIAPEGATVTIVT